MNTVNCDDYISGLSLSELWPAGMTLAQAEEAQLRKAEAEGVALGNQLFHLSHRVNLLRKDAAHYAPLLAYLPTPDLEAYPTGYYWPVEPVGRKAKADRAAWIEWGKENGVEG